MAEQVQRELLAQAPRRVWAPPEDYAPVAYTLSTSGTGASTAYNVAQLTGGMVVDPDVKRVKWDKG